MEHRRYSHLNIFFCLTIGNNKTKTQNKTFLFIKQTYLYEPIGMKVFGQLVTLGFDVTVFTPASYQRHSL